MSQTTFKGPARFAVYGGKEGLGYARVTGCNTLADAKAAIEAHLKTHPGCDYTIWEATWKEIKS